MSIALVFRLAPYAACVLAVTWALWERGGWQACEAKSAKDRWLAAEAALAATNAYNEREAERTREIEARHVVELLRVRREAKSREDAILSIKVTGAGDCRPFDALFDSLRRDAPATSANP